jgi:hypothetical protein
MDTAKLIKQLNPTNKEAFEKWIGRADPKDEAALWSALLNPTQDELVNARARVAWALAVLALNNDAARIVEFVRALPIDGKMSKPGIGDWSDASDALSHARKAALIAPTRRNLLCVAAAANWLADVEAGDALDCVRISMYSARRCAEGAANATAEAWGARTASANAPARGRAFDQAYVWTLAVDRAHQAQLDIIRKIVCG